MSAGFEYTDGRSESEPYSDIPLHHGVIDHPIGPPVNGVLLACLLGCLFVWGAVVFGIAAAV
jgi:hypothetical protein